MRNRETRHIGGNVILIIAIVSLSAVVLLLGGVFRSSSETNHNTGSGVSTAEVAYPAPLPTPTGMQRKPSDPFVRVIAPEVVDINPIDATKAAQAVIRSRVSQVLPPRWSTPDGSRPSDPFNSDEGIYTPVKITVLETYRGTTPSEIILNISGGVIGQDEVRVIPKELFTFTAGEEVLLFLARGDGSPNGSSMAYWDRYTVTADRQARNGFHTMPLDQLLTIIRRVPTPTAILTVVK